MELRKKGKEDHQETKLSVKNPTNDATFRKLTVPLTFGEKEKRTSAFVGTFWLQNFTSYTCEGDVMFESN